MEQKPLLLIINEPPEYQDLFIDTFGEEFNLTFMPPLTHQEKMQLKKWAQQGEICGAVCGLDAPSIIAQHSAWFTARLIFRLGIPVVCCTEGEYGDKTWKRLRGRFPELNNEVPYFALADEEVLSLVKSVLNQQIEKNEKRERRRQRLLYRFGRAIKNRFPLS